MMNDKSVIEHKWLEGEVPPEPHACNCSDGASPSREQNYPERKHPAHHPVYEHANRASIIFLTVCANNRKRLFPRDDVYELLLDVWAQADKWSVGRYVIMPDHIHLFCSPADGDFSLKKWVSYWKSMISRKWTRENEKPIWQNDYWDTQLRKGDSYSEKWHYVMNNPVRAGLVSCADDWPYQGEMKKLWWHD